MARSGAAGAREIADQLEPIAGPYGHRLHGHERRLLQRAARREEESSLRGPAIVGEVPAGRDVLLVVEEPAPIVGRHARDGEVSRRDLGEIRAIFPIGRIEHLPALAGKDSGGGEGPIAPRLEHHLHEICLGILGQDPLGARPQILADENRLVSAARVEPVELGAVVAEFDGARGQGIRHVDPGEELPVAAGAALQILGVAGIGLADAEADAELGIGEDPREPIIGQEQGAGAGRDVDAEDVRETLVSLIVGDQELIGEVARRLLDVRLDAGTRREGEDIARVHIDAMGLPVLVSTLISKERHVAIVVEPHDPGAQVAVGHPGERTRLREIVDLADP